MTLKFMGRKMGMTRLFDENGNHVVCTVISSEPHIVTQIKRKDSDGYEAVQLAALKVQPSKVRNVTKPMKGHFAKCGVDARSCLAESRVENAEEYKVGQEIGLGDFSNVPFVDVTGVSKGKGFQGTVKRYGIPIRQHKAEKTKRGIGNLGSWTPKRVEFSVALPGKMGYHLRTEYNKQLLRLGANGEEVTSTGGIIKYGVVRGAYALLKGSIIGPQRRAVVLTQSIRPNRYEVKEAPEITYLSVQK